MDNRMNILQKALQLFYEKGYDAIGVQEIADAAGVTKPTLCIIILAASTVCLRQLPGRIMCSLRDGLAERAEYAGDLPMNLERLTKFYLDFCSSHEAYYKLMMAMMYSAKGSDTYKVIYPCMQEYYQNADRHVSESRRYYRQYEGAARNSYSTRFFRNAEQLYALLVWQRCRKQTGIIRRSGTRIGSSVFIRDLRLGNREVYNGFRTQNFRIGHLFICKGDTFMRFMRRWGRIWLKNDGKAGTYFSVWAPNARSVSVVGDFNNWDRSAHPMQPVQQSGIWISLFRG